MSFWLHSFCGKCEGWDPVNRFNHTSWAVIITPTDRPKPVCNRRVMEVYGGVCVLSCCFLGFSVDVGAFVIGPSQIFSLFSLDTILFANIQDTLCEHTLYRTNPYEKGHVISLPLFQNTTDRKFYGRGWVAGGIKTDSRPGNLNRHIFLCLLRLNIEPDYPSQIQFIRRAKRGNLRIDGKRYFHHYPIHCIGLQSLIFGGVSPEHQRAVPTLRVSIVIEYNIHTTRGTSRLSYPAAARIAYTYILIKTVLHHLYSIHIFPKFRKML